MSRTLLRLAILALPPALLAGCQGSPFDGPSQVPTNSEQALIDGNGPRGPAMGDPLEGDLEEMNSRDTDEDPNLNGPG